MTFVPIDELKERGGMTLTPMIDFLFLMLAVFASLAFSRMAMKDTDIELVQSKSEALSSVAKNRDYKIVTISVMQEGTYKWVTEVRDHLMDNADEIKDELARQYQKGLLPEDKLKTQVLLKIDREAKWEPVLQVLLAVREAGFEVRPVYEPEPSHLVPTL